MQVVHKQKTDFFHSSILFFIYILSLSWIVQGIFSQYSKDDCDEDLFRPKSHSEDECDEIMDHLKGHDSLSERLAIISETQDNTFIYSSHHIAITYSCSKLCSCINERLFKSFESTFRCYSFMHILRDEYNLRSANDKVYNHMGMFFSFCVLAH